MRHFKNDLSADTPRLGLLAMYPAPGIIERIGPDWDWIWIDGQHGQLGYQDILAMVRACDLIQRPAFVRVPGHDYGAIGLALDTGADGLIVPVVDTPDQAQRVVEAAKFFPLGRRSYGGRRPIDRYGRTYSDTANNDIMLVAQIESPEAIENVNAIAAIPGVDALFLGPDDILLRRNVPMTAPRNEALLGQDMQAVMAACRQHGKVGVMVGIGPEMLRLGVKLGFQMIVSGGDVPLLANGSKQSSAEARNLLKGLIPAGAAAAAKMASSPY